MLAEHIIYSSALAILVGMVFYKYTGRDFSWIIILCAWAPDLDFIANRGFRYLKIRLLLNGSSIQHGTFHNIAFMVIFGIAMAFLLHPLGIKFFDSLFFSMIGFGAHLFEDALVYKVGYTFLWPFSSEVLGIGLLPNMMNEENYIRDFFGIANTEVLIIGLLLLLVAVIIRTWFEGSLSWLRCYMPHKMYENFFKKRRPNHNK
ncbi:MAG: metal-dependent hydrolase [Methanoregula sp.]|jgi:membrane-bound metal-dependent hydrolase YbcI (DUF457 family)